jgi:predicted amidophosphoribosyltransferase
MLTEYSHLISADVNDVMLQIHGIKKEEASESKLKVKRCPRCSTINEKEALFCNKCSSPLDVKVAMELDKKREEKEKLLAEIFGRDESLTQKLIEAMIKYKGRMAFRKIFEL